jgi:hypothetical protein
MVRQASGRRRRRRRGDIPRLVPPALLLLVFSCGSGDLPLEAVDPAAAPLHPTYEQVVPILDRACVPCHRGGGGEDAPGAGEAAPGGGANAPGGAAAVAEEDEGGDYSTCAGIHEGLEGIRETALDGSSMPPGAWPRLDEREKLILRRWMADGACSPCSSCR